MKSPDMSVNNPEKKFPKSRVVLTGILILAILSCTFPSKIFGSEQSEMIDVIVTINSCYNLDDDNLCTAKDIPVSAAFKVGTGVDHENITWNPEHISTTLEGTTTTTIKKNIDDVLMLAPADGTPVISNALPIDLTGLGEGAVFEPCIERVSDFQQEFDDITENLKSVEITFAAGMCVSRQKL